MGAGSRRAATQRQSKPIFTAWRPFSQVSESAISVTLVAKSDAVFWGGPIGS
jgi:hypothetical protein